MQEKTLIVNVLFSFQKTAFLSFGVTFGTSVPFVYEYGTIPFKKKRRNDKGFCSSSKGFVFLFDLNIFHYVTYNVIIGLRSRHSLYISLLLFA